MKTKLRIIKFSKNAALIFFVIFGLKAIFSPLYTTTIVSGIFSLLMIIVSMLFDFKYRFLKMVFDEEEESIELTKTLTKQNALMRLTIENVMLKKQINNNGVKKKNERRKTSKNK